MTTTTDLSISTEVPHERDTPNYSLYEIPFERGNVRLNVKLYLPRETAAQMGDPDRIKLTVEPAS